MIDNKDFIIDQTIIDIELCNLAAMMMKYATEEARLRLQVDTLEEQIKKHEADIDSYIRTTKKEEKPTEARIKGLIVTNERRQELVSELLDRQFEHNQMRWAVNALQAKRDCLVALAYRDRQLAKSDGWNKY